MLACVGDVEQDRLLGGRGSASLDRLFTRALLLRPVRETLDVLALDVSVELSSR